MVMIDDLSASGKLDAVDVGELKERLKFMYYLASFSTNKKGADVRKIRKIIARRLTISRNNDINKDTVV